MQETLQSFVQGCDGEASRCEVMNGPTGRGVWSRDLKVRIVAETLVPGGPVVVSGGAIVGLETPSFSSVRLTGRCELSTRRMISSFSDAGYLIRGRPYPRSRFF